MNSLPKTAADVENQSTATLQTKNAYKRGTPGEGTFYHRDANQKDASTVWHKFSKKMAYQLNPKSPDVAGASILYGLSLWMKASKRFKQGYCYRSLSQLAVEYPYLSEEGIRKALMRLQKSLTKDFTILGEGKTLRFRVSDKIIRQMEKAGNPMFRIEDAVKHGIPAALLLANLSWQFLPYWDDPNPYRKNTATKDEDGVDHFPMSPSVLTEYFNDKLPILPMSRWTVTRALKDLTAKGAIKPHPSRKHYYTISPQRPPRKCQQLPVKVEESGAKVANDGAKVASNVAKVADSLCIDSNDIVNEYSNVFYPDTVPASPTLCGDEASPSLKNLLDIVNRELAISKQKVLNQPQIATVPASQLPYDLIRSQYDLPYDHIPLNPLTSRPYLHHHQVRDWMDEIAHGWRFSKFHYTRKDLNAIADIFMHVHSFRMEHFEDICLHVGGWSHNYITGEKYLPVKSGEFDPFFFARKITSAPKLIKYLPHIIKEMHSDVCCVSGVKGEWEKFEHVSGSFKDVLCYLEQETVTKEFVTWDSNPVTAATLLPPNQTQCLAA